MYKRHGFRLSGAPETALADRLQVVTVTAPAGVIPGVSNYRIWGSTSLVVGPVYTVPFADCGTLVGYTTGTVAVAPRARVARPDAQDKLVTTYDLGAFTVRGLAAGARWSLRGALVGIRDESQVAQCFAL